MLDGFVEQWPYNYDQLYLERFKVYELAEADPAAADAYYSTRPAQWIEDWAFTFDPRNAGTDTPTLMPFKMFPRQHEFVNFLEECLHHQSAGLVEKSRDMGATWVACAYSTWLWKYRAGSSVGFGSRKEMLVDRAGDMDSIFEKIRTIIRNLPLFMWPEGFNLREHSSHMKLINPANDASITGEAGGNIGRGGRKLIYFKDESAHYTEAEGIEAALMDNTNVQIDISSVNGVGNVFYRRRQSAEVWHGEITDPKKTYAFIFDWQDHPAKTREWYNDRKAKAEEDGLEAEFAQEVDRSYTSSVRGTLIKAEWIEAAYGLAEDFELDVSGKKRVAMDVGDDGISGDKNAVAFIEGLELKAIDSWGLIDTGLSAGKAILFAKEHGARDFQYDAIGVGAGVKASINQMKRSKELPENFAITPWVASGKVINPWDPVNPDDDDPTAPKNKDFFHNFKTQAWWAVRRRFYEAWKCREGRDFNQNLVLSISRDIPKSVLQEIVAELSQPTRSESVSGKMLVDKSPNGSRSPNVADAIVMAGFPAIVTNVHSSGLK